MVSRKRKIITDWILSVIRWWILILNCFLVCYVGFYPDLCYGLSSKTDWHLFFNESFLMGTLGSWAIFSLKGDGCTYVPHGTSEEITNERELSQFPKEWKHVYTWFVFSGCQSVLRMSVYSQLYGLVQFSVYFYASESSTCRQFESYSLHTYKFIIKDIDLFVNEYLEIRNLWRF